MIDIHAHFAEEGYDFPAEWEKIQAAGVHTVVLAGDTVAHSMWHRDFAHAYAGAYFTAGVHPSCEDDFKNIPALRTLAQDEKCVAIGEIGLDYHYEEFDRKAQHAAFAEQILLADELDLPLQIHSRDACADTLAILRENRAHLRRGFLMHCYSYGQENLANYLDLGAFFSFGGVTCFKNARRAVEAVAACPVERILSETDSPYLSPYRGEKNTPANIPTIVGKLAEIKGMGAEEMNTIIERNAKTLFGKLK